MRIKRMTATFGSLDHETLELEEGLNILTLPNEGGKSTWCAFLRVMLYGLNTRERDKKGFLADKTRYQPWSGAAMEGELLCSWRGRDILIRRYQKGSTPLGGFEAIYADTGTPVAELNADNVGDVMIGVSRSVYERSAFLGQSALTVSQTPELEKRLAAVVSSGEDGVSASQVSDTLSDWRRKRQYHTRGAIPTLEGRRSELELALDNARDVTTQIRNSRLNIDRYEELRAKLKHQLDLYEAQSASAQADAYGRAAAELKQAQEQLRKLEEQVPESGFPPKKALEQGRDEVALLRSVDAGLKQAGKEVPPAKAALERAQEAARDDVFSGDAATARAKAQEVRRNVEALKRQEQTAGRNRWLFPLIFGVPAIGGAGCALLLRGGALLPGCGAAAALAVLAIVLGAVWNGKKKKCAAAIQKALADCHAADLGAVDAHAEDYCARLAEADRLRAELERFEKTEADLNQQRQTHWTNLRTLVDTFAPEVKDVFGFSAAITRALTLLDSLEKAEERQENAQRLFDAVAAHGKGVAGALAEQPAMPLEQAQAGFQEAERRLNQYHNELSMAMGYSSAKGGAEAIQAELESIDQQLEHYHLDYDALGIALEALEEADAEMRNRFSPELNRRAGIYLSQLTGGRYAKVRLNREMEAGAEERDGVATRDVISLSRGTADQLWLAVRLAVCDLALPQDEPCPLVLDEALVNFDDQRLLPALELLGQLSQRRQILLFTCQGREQRTMDERGGHHAQ